jgi:hypothetical protein
LNEHWFRSLPEARLEVRVPCAGEAKNRRSLYVASGSGVVRVIVENDGETDSDPRFTRVHSGNPVT